MNEINGVICINKPQDFTSFDVVAIMRRAAGTRKIGHGGTLDPMATGVLPIYIGRAAKTADLNPVSDKRYRATFGLGVTTDTEDVWGKVLTKSEKPVTPAEITDAVKTMQGDIMQIPPMYSAVKINGKRLYDLARQGVEVERAARPVTVYSIELSDYDEEKRTGTLDIYCSKGTYIRTLCHDIGEKLGVGAAMDQLLRTKVSIFEVDQALTLAQIEERIQQEDRSFVLPVDQLFTQYPKMQVADEEAAKMLRNGNPITIGKLKSFNEVKKYQNKSRVLVYNENGEFRAIYELRGNYYRVVKMF